MEKVAELNQRRLRLSPAVETRTLADGSMLLKQTRRLEYLALPPALARIMPRLTGDLSVEQLLRKLLHEPERPEIRHFYDLVLNALDRGFLVDAHAQDVTAAASGPRALSWPLGWGIRTVLLQAAILAPLGALAFSSTPVEMPLTLGGWLVTLLCIMVMLSVGNLLSTCVLQGYGRSAYTPRFRLWHAGMPHLTLDLRDGFMAGRICQVAVALQKLCIPLMTAALSGLLQSPAIFFAAWIMLLSYICPFGATPARTLLHLIFHKDHQLPSSLHLFLGKRLLLKLLFSRIKSDEEVYLTLYATFAFAWLGGVLFFAGERLWDQSSAVLDHVFFSPDPVTRVVSTILAVLLLLLATLPLLYQAWILLRNLYGLTLAHLFNSEKRTLRRHAGKSRPPAAEILAFIQGNLLFSQLPEDEQKLIAEAMQWMSLKSGHVIMREGDNGDTLWVLRSGQARVTKEDDAGMPQELAVLGPGDVFGEIALLNKVPRTATVRALTPVDAFVLQKEAFERVVMPALGAAKIRTIIQICSWLKRHALFADWPSQALLQLAWDFEFADFATGTTAIQENTKNESFYIVYEGAFEVRRSGKPVAILGPGEFFGEISLLQGIPTTADVVATAASKCLRLGRDTFFKCLSQDALTGISVEAVLVTRWQQTEKTS